MADKNVHIEQDTNGIRGTVHWQPKHWRWPVFGIVFTLLDAVLWLMSDLGLALAASPFIGYIAASVSFNRTEVRMDGKRVEWKERPFPTRRMRRVKLEEIECWAYGRTPSSGKSSSSSSSEATFSVALRRNNGKIMRLVDSLPDQAMAQDIASQFASHTSLPVKQIHSLRGPAKRFKHVWILAAALAGFVAVASLVIWSSNQ